MPPILQTGQLKMEPKKPQPLSPVDRKTAESLGLRIADETCPKCGSAMFVKRAPCWMRRQGFATAKRCVHCGRQFPFEKKTK